MTLEVEVQLKSELVEVQEQIRKATEKQKALIQVLIQSSPRFRTITGVGRGLRAGDHSEVSSCKASVQAQGRSRGAGWCCPAASRQGEFDGHGQAGIKKSRRADEVRAARRSDLSGVRKASSKDARADALQAVEERERLPQDRRWCIRAGRATHSVASDLRRGRRATDRDSLKQEREPLRFPFLMLQLSWQLSSLRLSWLPAFPSRISDPLACFRTHHTLRRNFLNGRPRGW